MWNIINPEMINMLKSYFRVRCGWKTFSPSLYQNGDRSSSIARARYYLDDKHAIVSLLLSATAAGSAGNNVYVLLPTFLTPASGQTSALPIGVFTLFDTGSAVYHGNAVYVATASGLPAVGCQYATDGNVVGANPNMALASGDTVGMHLSYEVA